METQVIGVPLTCTKVAYRQEYPLENVSPVVLAVSDTNMINLASRFCDSSTQLYPFHPLYVPLTCSLEDRKFTVIGHDEGHSHSAPFYQALAHQGAKTIVKAGTCCTLKPSKVPIGSLMVPPTVVTDPQMNGTCAQEYVPVTPTPRVYTTLREAGREEELIPLTGDSLSTAAFTPNSLDLQSHLERWADKAETAEPDLYNLFYTSPLREVECAGILAVTKNPYDAEKTGEERPFARDAIENMIRIAVRTCAILSGEYEENI